MIKYFEINRGKHTLRGMLHEGSDLNPIIIVHGYFSANKIGPHRLYYELAEVLSNIGFSVIRMDLSGMGESDGDISKVDFQDQVDDVYCCIDKLLNFYGTYSKIHLIGHCVGCCNVLLQCINPQCRLTSVTLLCPFIPSVDNFKKLLGTNAYTELNRKGYALRNGLYCRKSFIDAGYTALDKKILEQAVKYKPLAYIASNDELSDIHASMDWCTSNNIPNVIIKNADHNFIDPVARKLLFSQIRNRFQEMKSL